jgi:hypothetical protein
MGVLQKIIDVSNVDFSKKTQREVCLRSIGAAKQKKNDWEIVLWLCARLLPSMNEIKIGEESTYALSFLGIGM